MQVYQPRLTCPGVCLSSSSTRVAPSGSEPYPIHLTLKVKVRVLPEEPRRLRLGLGLAHVAIRSHCGKFLRAYPPDWRTEVDLADAQQAWEIWTLIKCGEGTVVLMSMHRQLLQAHRGTVRVRAPSPCPRSSLPHRTTQPYEHWRVVAGQHGKVAVVSVHGRSLRAGSGSNASNVGLSRRCFDRLQVAACEQWEISAV